MTNQFFQDLILWNVGRSGTGGTLPARYYDTLTMSGVFTAATGAVRKLLPRPDLFPFELVPGRSLVAFTAFEYRRTDLDPYNELAISFLVSHLRKPIPLLSIPGAMRSNVFPTYVWQLPVTTEIARAGGVDLYGFPKFIADIQFTKEKEWVGCSLSLAGSELLRMRGRVLPTRPGKLVRYFNYSILDGALVISNALCNPLQFSQSINRPDMELSIGEGHPMCQALRELQLGRRPVIYQYIPLNESILFAGRNARDV